MYVCMYVAIPENQGMSSISNFHQSQNSEAIGKQRKPFNPSFEPITITAITRKTLSKRIVEQALCSMIAYSR